MTTTSSLLETLAQASASSLPEAARLYVQAGLPVFPLEPCGKAPLVPRGFYAASTDLSVVNRWWQRWPRANIGVPTGPATGWWVLDIDPAHGGLTSLDQVVQQGWQHLSETLMQHTGGNGVHLVYQPRKGVQLPNATGFAGLAGLDLRVQGGYIVVAPSLHRSGGCYRWHPCNEIAPFPELLLTLFKEHRQRQFATRPSSPSPDNASSGRSSCSSKRETDPAYWLACAVKYAVPGRRHAYALFLACHLVDDAGLAWAEAAPWMCEYAGVVPQDGFSEEEALACLDWALNKRSR